MMPVNEEAFGHFWLDLTFEAQSHAMELAEALLSQHGVDFERLARETWEAHPRRPLDEAFLEARDGWQLREQFPQYLRRALFLVCYTRIEGILNSLCHAAKGQQNLPLSLGDLKGSGIRRAKRYLTRLAGVSEPFQTSDWRQLTNYNELRNVLVHGEGVLQDTSQHQTLRGFVDRHQLLDLDDNGFIIIRQGFCEEVVYAAHCFFAEFPYELIVAVSPDGV